MDLNHFPCETEKKELLALAEDEGVVRAFRTATNAVANMQHAISDSDRDLIVRIIASDQARLNAKLLAENSPIFQSYDERRH